MATIDQLLSCAVALDGALGNPLDDDRPGSFRRTVEADRQCRFPQKLCAAALQWGLAEHLIPEECGGRFRAVEECFALSRVLSRRDLTAAIAIGASLLASIPVWLRGTLEQKHTVADLLRENGFLSLALSERGHGADILANEVTARRAAGGWRIDGTKWLINNAGHASGATVAASTGEGFRSLTLFLTTRAAADDAQWTPLPKIHTHGLRGSAFGGLTFSGLAAQDGDIIGKMGQGLEILLTTFQITRVMVGSFALGALDTCLRAAVSFARSRRLYGRAIIELEPVRCRLVDAYTELLIGETAAHAACRAVQLRPDQLPLMSPCVKFLVPQMAAEGIESLSVVLGARSYLAGEHWCGVAEKMRRDCAVTALFDGSAPVTVDAIIDQLPGLALARAEGNATTRPGNLFCRAAPPLPWVNEVDFDLATDSDDIFRGVAAARGVIQDEKERLAYGWQLLELLDWCQAEMERLDTDMALRAGDADWRRSGAAHDLASRYCHLHFAGACCWKWLEWRDESPEAFVTSGAWLAVCLRRLAARAGMEREVFDDLDHAAFSRMERAYDERYLFSDLDFPVS